MGIDIDIPLVFASALSWWLAAVIALVEGSAFCCGGRKHVEEGMNTCTRSGRAKISTFDVESDRDTGSDSETERGSTGRSSSESSTPMVVPERGLVGVPTAGTNCFAGSTRHTDR